MKNRKNPLRDLIERVNQEAINLNHQVVDLEHLLLALMKTGGLESRALTAAGANYDLLRAYLIKKKGVGDQAVKSPEVGEDLAQVIENVNIDMRRDRVINNFGEYFLKNLLWTDSLATKMLRASNVNPQEVYNLLSLYRKERDLPKAGAGQTNIDKYGEDLNKKALKSIDGVIGREDEIDRIIQVLSRRTKNNPVLVGEAGVGKTAIVEGLAKKIALGQVPDVIKDKRIISVDMAQMVAGTKYRGDFEQRISDTLKEVASDDNTILFIDEIHTIIGAGSSEGGLDASNIMKPYLSKGDLKIIGATTIGEYRRHIEKDPALERRMQPIMIEEPSVEETIDIIKGIKDNYEKFHKVKIGDQVIDEAVKLSDRYLVDRFLPDKAIDVIDEAASMVKVKNYEIPDKILELTKDIDKLKKEKSVAVNTQNFEQAAFLRDQIVRLENDLYENRRAHDQDTNYKADINIEEVRKIISDWSNVPITQLTETEMDKYLNLDKNLKGQVIGQDQAVDTVSKAIKRARVGLKGEDSPIGTFIFVGPTGVGKTYLAKSIAYELFGSEDDLIRIDMSEYMEKHTVSKLVGSPPGYVGYEEGGQLTDAVRDNPYSVILFDEIEKAHPDVFNILLQVLDEGRLTDSQGTEVDFTNTIIILTSNAGASRLTNTVKIGFGSEDQKKKEDYENIKSVVNEELKNLFRPEFLNRIDDIIVFNRLDKKDVREIVKLKLDDLIYRMEDIGYEGKYTDKVVDYIADEGFDEEYGARPLERAIKKEIEDLLAEEILEGGLDKKDRITIGIRNKKIYVKGNKVKAK
mgnify:FL=1